MLGVEIDVSAALGQNDVPPAFGASGRGFKVCHFFRNDFLVVMKFPEKFGKIFYRWWHQLNYFFVIFTPAQVCGDYSKPVFHGIRKGPRVVFDAEERCWFMYVVPRF